MLRYVLGAVGIWGIGASALRVTFVAPEICPPVTADTAVSGAEAAAEWILGSQGDDGRYVYEYNRETGAFGADYNYVRHAGVTMSLYQMAASGDSSVIEGADRGLAFMEESLYEHDDWVAFAEAGTNPSLGSSALMLASLSLRREATGGADYDDLMRELGHFIVRLQQPDGGFLARWDARLDVPVPNERSKYYTGEATWALALLHNQLPGEGWDVAAMDAMTYLANDRDRVEGYDFPPWADQWAAYSLKEMADWGLGDDHIAYAESLAERFGFLVRVESRRTDSWLSETLNGRQARAAGLGTWVEALTSLHAVGADPRMGDAQAKIRERMECSAGMLLARQQDGSDSGDPSVTAGAWFTNGVTRMDDQQHALSGLLYTGEILSGGTADD